MSRRMRSAVVPLAGLTLCAIAALMIPRKQVGLPFESVASSPAGPAPVEPPRDGLPFFPPNGGGLRVWPRNQRFGLQPAVVQEDSPAETARKQARGVAVPVPSLRADAALGRKLDAARDCLKEEAWGEAAYLLQGLLDHPDDVLVSVKRASKDGGEVTVWTGIRGEAERLLRALPADGREFYETRYAPRSKALLAEARQHGDMNRVAEIARRYPATPAGGEATLLLAVHHLDRARYHLAAVCFARLLGGRDAASLAPAAWFQAALAFRRSGDGPRARQAWDRFTSLAPNGVRVGDRDLSLSVLRKELDAMDSVAAFSPPNVERYPGLESRWCLPTAYDNFTRGWIQTAGAQQEGRSQPVVPALCPLPSGDRVIFRSHRGVHAVNVSTGREAWDTPLTWSMDQMASQRRFAMFLETWVSGYFEYSPHAVFENSVIGTLTCDGSRVFAVDDLAVPPYRSNYRPPGRWRQEQAWPEYGAGLTEAAYHNRLVALDAATGQRLWDAGGFAEDPDDGELLGAYFLGPPLPIDGRLYGVMEKNSELLLICLDTASGALVWKQPLAFAPTRLLLDPGRRLQASRPVFSQGVLVCATNAGVVLGVDLVTPALLWAYPYRTQSLTQSMPTYERRGRSSPAQVIAEWKAPTTVVDGDRVVFTAADEASIHCLSLRDGSLLWRQDRARDDLWLAGLFANRLLVVGRRGCRAIDVANGRQLWQVETGQPTGQGVARGPTYYLPLKENAAEQPATICAINLEKGQIVGRVPAKDNPGNLFFHNGELLSQSASAVIAYTREKEKPKEERENNAGPKDEKRGKVDDR